MNRFWSDTTNSIVPYVPGEQPKDKILIKLNTNESPYPPSPRVIERIRECTASDIRLYPDPESSALKKAVAEYNGIAEDQIFPGNGSDEVLAFLYQAFFNTSERIAYPDITYSFYPVYSQLYGIPSLEIPLENDFSIDFSRYPEDLRAILFANPNAPTGIVIPVSEIEKLVKSRPNTLIIVDEAYVDFGSESCVPLINQYDNLLVVQTLSKSRALAGMRIGLALGRKELIEGLNRIKNSFNSYTMDRLAQAAATSAFEDVAYYKDMQRKIIDTRERTKAMLSEMGVPCTDSKSNFLFVSIPGVRGPEAMRLFRDDGILVRNLKTPRITDWLRISIGSDSDMDKVVACIKKMI